MQRVEWKDCLGALIMIAESPNAEKGYEDLRKYFYSNNLKNEYAAVDFLLKEKFNDHSSSINKE